MKTLFVIFLLPLLAFAEDESPFSKIIFQQLQFAVPDGKVIVVQADGHVRWPKGIPGADVVAVADALVCEKATDVTKADYTHAQAILDWNRIVSKLEKGEAFEGKTDEQAQAVWRCLKKLFPHVFK